MRSYSAPLFLFFFAGFFLAGCEEADMPIPEPNVPTDGKTVLVEDFTGVSCQNCPTGARIIDGLKAQFGSDRVISIAAYTRGFDNPHPTSRYDLHGLLEDEAQSLQENIDILTGKPAAAVNRVIDPQDNNRFYTNSSAWQTPVVAELERTAELNLNITNQVYDAGSRRFSAELRCVVAEDLDEDINYTVVLIQNGIIDPQLDLDGWDLDYEHNNVLVDVVTEPEGDAFAERPLSGAVLSTAVTAIIPPEDDGLFIASDMEVIAFVHYGSAENKEVLGVVKVPLVQ